MTPPAFKIQIRNDNEHIVRFKGAVLKLADKDRVLYDVLSKGQLKENNRRAFQKAESGSMPEAKMNETLNQIEDAIDNIKLLDHDSEILPGFSGTYYITFDLPTKSFKSESELNQWVMRHTPFTLMLFDVIIATDAAGKVSQKSRFQFPINAELMRQTYEGGKLIRSEKL